MRKLGFSEPVRIEASVEHGLREVLFPTVLDRRLRPSEV